MRVKNKNGDTHILGKGNINLDIHYLFLFLGTFRDFSIRHIKGGAQMALPRSKYVQEGKPGVFHCFSRCVRRAFLYGFDSYSGRDYSHRKAWIVNRLRLLASIFAIDVCNYSVMENHYHTILRVRPDIASSWSAHDVASRWLTLFPKYHRLKGLANSPLEDRISALLLDPQLIETLRSRLSSLSWFMGCLNEFIARAANKEDDVKGRFWESRFKCQALLDDAAIAACMVYVDLNPIRAGLAKTPEESDFTSIQQRIRAWYKNTLTSATEPTSDSHDWLCPISSLNNPQGILPMTTAEYLDMVDRSGRMIRLDKQGAMDPHLSPILLRIGVNSDAWPVTISCFGDKFSLAAGVIANLRDFAHQLGRRWFKGIAQARAAFLPST